MRSAAETAIGLSAAVASVRPPTMRKCAVGLIETATAEAAPEPKIRTGM